MPGDKWVLVKGRNGLGNRILVALTGILYARLSGRRLLVDWSDRAYSRRRSNVFHEFFHSPVCDPDDPIPSTDSVRPAAWRGQLHRSASPLERQAQWEDRARNPDAYALDLGRIDYPEDVVVLWGYDEEVDLLREHFHGPFSGLRELSTPTILRGLLRADLTPHRQIREGVRRFERERFRRPTVGVQVRYTDRKISLDVVLERLDALLRERPDLQIFLATDNVEIKALFERTYERVISTPHWYPAAGARAHQNRECPNPTKAGIEALVDLYLLAECDYLIVDTLSSFAGVATLLTKAPPGNVFDVQGGRKVPRGPRQALAWRRRGWDPPDGPDLRDGESANTA